MFFKSCCVCVCLSVAEAPGTVKVTEWQQTYYGTDSGIQSGATTVRSDEEGTEYSNKKFTYATTFTENPAGEKHIIYCMSKLFYCVVTFTHQFTIAFARIHTTQIYFRLFPSKISIENAKISRLVYNTFCLTLFYRGGVSIKYDPCPACEGGHVS